MPIKTPDDLRKLREIGKIVAGCMRLMQKNVRPGITTKELDDLAGEYLKSQGARSAPQVMYKFPGVTCICVGEEIAHGIPSAKRKLKAGDLINLDVSAEKDGLFGDMGASMIVQPSRDPLLEKLCQASQEALQAAIDVARAGVRVAEIGRAIESVAKRHGFTVIRNLCGHGIGHKLHEDPQILGYYEPRDKKILQENQALAIEAFISNGATMALDSEEDDWTLLSEPHLRTAQFEHTVLVTKSKPIILTE